MPAKHSWAFKSHLRTGAFGWNGSHLACFRLKEAVAEIEKAAKSDPVAAAGGVVALMERIWPAFQHVDTSSGALGGTVVWAQSELLPILISAPADCKTREKWLGRLWQAVQDDGVSYLSMVEERWGEICGSPAVASAWADKLLAAVRKSFSDSRSFRLFAGTTICLSSLLAAGRHQDLLDTLALLSFPFWHDRQFGVKALLAEGRPEDALGYIEASRRPNQTGAELDAACERILLDLGRVDEAFEKYAFTANIASTGLSTYRAIRKKYPSRDPREILTRLAHSSGEPGRWFAAAKDAGLLGLAMEFAQTGRTDPRTLARACRDFLQSDPRFSLEIGRLAIQRILEGHGYEITFQDVNDAFIHLAAAAHRLSAWPQTRDSLLAMAAEAVQRHSQFAATIMHLCSSEPAAAPIGPSVNLSQKPPAVRKLLIPRKSARRRTP
ncbi:MAG: hypothetical protein HXY18_01630 [Bryobacteraceae bacterium]|nr:hypothetical protein [Bryobacteraceae bacterium]